MFAAISRAKHKRFLGGEVAPLYYGSVERPARSCFKLMRSSALGMVNVLFPSMSRCYDFFEHGTVEASAVILSRFAF